MKQTWRWFGPNDPVSLVAAKQAGASGIVTALHEAYDGERAWCADAVATRKRMIEAAGLTWDVVESIPVHNSIKTRAGEFRRHREVYKQSIRAVGRAGIKVVCYNFLPLVDWVRTDLRYQVKSGGYALRLDLIDFIAYDVFILARPHADANYDNEAVRLAERRYRAMNPSQKADLERNIIAGLPGGTTTYGRGDLLRAYEAYAGLSKEDLRGNLIEFLQDIVPTAEESGVRMCIHPDDPPIELFGLPRVTSTAEDIRKILVGVDSIANGLTFCVGSLAVNPANNLHAMAEEFGPKIHFAHLRNIVREADGSFYESDHLNGSFDMLGIVRKLLDEEGRRRNSGRLDSEIPIRPDHGHLLLDDQSKPGVNPGYSAVGRLKGLAELRGAMQAFAWSDRSRHA